MHSGQSTLSFIKMHGCGNDYIFIDCFCKAPPPNPAMLAIQLSDRHTAIGSDGLVLMLPPDSTDRQGRMRMFNSDGSEGSICGNALRCFAMWLFHSGYAEHTCQIGMSDRTISAEIMESDISRRTAVIRVNMGPPTIQSSGDEPAYACQLALADVITKGISTHMTCVSMGNPHAVIFVDDLSRIDFESSGRRIEHHPTFPDRTNVEFAEVLSGNRARVRVWERGSGETMACGSGACAAAIAGISQKHFSRQQPVIVEMRGGNLQIEWASNGNVYLQGPAAEVFRGTLLLPSCL